MLQVGLVGCAHIHTPGFIKRMNAHSDVKVKYVWDHDLERAKKSAAALNSEVTADLDKIWSDKDITTVIVCAETDRHEAIVVAAAAAGKNLFVEKPLGMGAADAYRMAAAIDKAGVLFQTGYFMRSEPINRFLRDQIKAGNFGKITRALHFNFHAGSLNGIFDTDYRWMVDVKQSGIGGFGDLGTHSLDILMWLLGDVERVTAITKVVTGRYGDCDETGEGLIEFASGIPGTIGAGWLDLADSPKLVISGTEAHAQVVNGQLYYKCAKVSGADGTQPWTDLPAALPHAFELFLNAARGEKDVPLVTAQEAAARSAVMEAFYSAAQQQAWVKPARS